MHHNMMRRRKGLISVMAVFALLYAAVSWLGSCNPGSDKEQKPAPADTAMAYFTGSASCQSCHASQYSDWLQSDHFMAMAHATDTTVLGDFNNAQYTADGITSRFFTRNGSYYINTEGDDGKSHDYQVRYTFGYFPLQQYLVEFPGGRLQATRVTWDSRNKKWFHQYAGQRIDHNDWLHWTNNSQNWNTMCASCHSTGLKKQYSNATDTYNTTWKEINVSCESCHGPGSNHILLMRSGKYNSDTHHRNTGLVYGRDTSAQLQLNTCAPCHARKTDVAEGTVYSHALMDHIIPQNITNEHYFADGQILDEDYEYGSFTHSKMFGMGVRCSNCHNPHSGKILASGNKLCLSCHQPSYDAPAHHFHKQGDAGAQCVNCHMATRTYMGVDVRRDHSFRIPRPDQSVKYGTPNACTGCHTGETDQWAADAVVKWYGPRRAYHFSDDLLPGSLQNRASTPHLIKLLGDTAQPAIARAAAASYLSGTPSREAFEALDQALSDDQSMVRYYALRALANYPQELWKNKAWRRLTDKVKAVRIAAADLYHQMPVAEIPREAQTDFQRADSENRDFLINQADFAIGNVMLADYFLQANDHVDAIRYYLRGLEKDSLMNYARLNLSAAYNMEGKNEKSLHVLLDAAAIDPQNERIYYNLGLLYYELSNYDLALTSFQQADRLGSRNPSLYYNYGVLLNQKGQLAQAEKMLLKGYAIDSTASNIRYALAFLYMSERMPEKAMAHADFLHRTDPNNPAYTTLFRNMGY